MTKATTSEEATPVKKKKSQGRKVIPIARIQNKDSCQVTFSKRKTGLFKKVSETIVRCDAYVAVIIFSNAGKPYALGGPSVDDVLRVAVALRPGDDDDALLPAVPDRAGVEATVRRLEETKELVAAEKLRMRAIDAKVMQAAGGRKWWEADVEKLGPQELPEFAMSLQRLRDNLIRHVATMSV
ncbi:hypothetical protein QOZ80_6BG0501460 [Eleusine coracana subsp. coracana]|nr:hypothetical protein QOZ80_6BG0501460 [Eleusine coracana subsp. coracana]